MGALSFSLLFSLPSPSGGARPRLIAVTAETDFCGEASVFSQHLSAAVENKRPLSATDALPAVTLRQADTLIAEVSFPQTTEPRRLRSTRGDCAVLLRSAAIVIVTALENERQRATVLHAPASEVALSLPAVERLRIGIGVDTALGVMPQIALGLRGGVALERGALGLELALEWLQSTVFTRTTTRLDATLFDAQAAACYTRVWFFGCGVVAAGVMRTRVLDSASHARSPWIAVAARAGYRLSTTSPWQLRIFAELWIPFTRTEIALDSQTLWHSAPVAGGAGVAIDFLHRL